MTEFKPTAKHCLSHGLNKQMQQQSLSEIGLAKIQASVESFMRGRASHQCKQCGFHGKALYWQCPSCHQWSSINKSVFIKSKIDNYVV